jgi:hypothetical protein
MTAGKGACEVALRASASGPLQSGATRAQHRTLARRRDRARGPCTRVYTRVLRGLGRCPGGALTERLDGDGEVPVAG